MLNDVINVQINLGDPRQLPSTIALQPGDVSAIMSDAVMAAVAFMLGTKAQEKEAFERLYNELRNLPNMRQFLRCAAEALVDPDDRYIPTTTTERSLAHEA